MTATRATTKDSTKPQYDSGLAVSVVIPCYCSGSRLGDLVEQFAAALQCRNHTFELILVDDASPDDTWQCIQALAERYSFIDGVSLLTNSGQFRATLCGIEQARGEIVVTMDDDLQQLPSDIPLLLNALAESPDLDCVFGAYKQKRHGLLRNSGTFLMGRLNELIYNKPHGLHMTSFRAMRSCLAHALCEFATVNPIINPMILQLSGRLGNVTVQHQPRQSGHSGYSFRKLVTILIDNIFNGSVLPLRLVSATGWASVLVSICLGIYYLCLYSFGKVGVPGFATTVLLIIFFGGLTLMSFGLVGEYLLRITQEVRRPPRFVIRSTTMTGELRSDAKCESQGS